MTIANIALAVSLTLVSVSVIIGVSFASKCESLEDFDEDVFQNSLRRELQTDIRYQTAYYYELDNDSFEEALSKCFGSSSHSAQNAITASKWMNVSVIEPSVLKAYRQAKNMFVYLLDRGNQFFVLPDSSNPALQLAGDRLTAGAYNAMGTFLIKCEFVVFRQNKFQGKHIGCVCTVKNDPHSGAITSFIQLKVIGVVSADNIPGLSLPGIGM